MMRGKSPPSDVEMYHVADRKLQIIPLFNYFLLLHWLPYIKYKKYIYLFIT